MARVDFMIAGTQMGGTSALNAVLRNHPDLVMCDVKEPHFFDTEAHFQGTPDFDAYHAQFPDNSAARMTGEATPDYLYWPPEPFASLVANAFLRWKTWRAGAEF